jgi:MFS family permease
VLTRPFVNALTLAFLGFGFEQLLRPVIPLLVIDRGGDVVLVGVVAAVHALPSILFRPTVGRLIDGKRHRSVLRVGAAIAAVGPSAILLSDLRALAAVRFVQGTGWALYSVSTHTLVARLSPARKRGEASGYFMSMPALATALCPAIGVGLYAATGAIGPVAAATGVGLATIAVSSRTTMPERGAPSPGHQRSIGMAKLIEPAALPATLLLTLFLGPQALFTVFPPVYALTVGAPIESLALYYPAYGGILFLSQLTAGRVSDILGRGTTIRIGCGIAVIGLAVAAVGGGMPTFIGGAAAFAIAVSLVTPTTSALAMDRAPAHRLGSAMATYSVGFQLATGASSLLWGGAIAAGGFTFAFALAMTLLIVAATASLWLASTPTPEPGSRGAAP